MSLWDRVASDVNDVLLNTTDGLTCTAVQLPGGQSFTGFYADDSSAVDNEYGIANTIKGKLWIETTEQISQRSTWNLTLPDGSTIEATGVSHGERSGALLCVHLERVKVSQFSGTGSFR